MGWGITTGDSGGCGRHTPFSATAVCGNFLCLTEASKSGRSLLLERETGLITEYQKLPWDL